MKTRYVWTGLLMLLIAGQPALAQFDKGTTFIGGTLDGSGTVGWSKVNPDKLRSSTHDVSLTLQWGKFVRQHVLFGVGLNLGFVPAKSEYKIVSVNGGVDKLTSTTFGQEYGIGPYLRWYKPLGEKLSFFIHHEAGFSLLRAHYKTVNPTVGNRGPGDGFLTWLAVAPGISYRFNGRFALESDLNLMSLRLNYQDVGSRRSFYASSAFSSNLNSLFSLRAAWYLPKR